jgi:hypothetical protein
MAMLSAPFALATHKVRDGTLRRFLYIAAVAFWLGGFTFYSAVVIHVGHRVLASRVRQGLVTQVVTNWLNFAGCIALVLMLWSTLAIGRSAGRWTWRIALAALVIMTAVQAELLILHPMMDALIDIKARAILDEIEFRRLHLIYMTSATVQWGAGIIHIWCTVSGAAGGCPTAESRSDAAPRSST